MERAKRAFEGTEPYEAGCRDEVEEYEATKGFSKIENEDIPFGRKMK